MRTITQTQIKALIEEAEKSERKRTIFRLHEHDEPVQRMVNALVPGTYITPHKHENPDKVELMSILFGRVALIQFTDSGEVKEIHIIGKHEDNKIVDIPPRTYHTMVALAPSAVLEIIQGPYDAATHKQFAPFAPLEGEDGTSDYLRQLEDKLGCFDGFYRTNVTELSTDELIILDTFFDDNCALSIGNLTRRYFRESNNVKYSHRFSDDEIQITLDKFVELGYLISQTSEQWGFSYKLTSQGGAVWESERDPDWNSFYREYTLSEDEVSTIESIASTSSELLHQFFVASIDCKRLTPNTQIMDALTHQHVDDFIYWKHFETLYELRYPFTQPRMYLFPEYRECFRQKQTWWRNTAELVRLKNKLTDE
ncbi:MAG: WbuC family cupin fold metalloprotein [Aggregatilineales bacterium]